MNNSEEDCSIAVPMPQNSASLKKNSKSVSVTGNSFEPADLNWSDSFGRKPDRHTTQCSAGAVHRGTAQLSRTMTTGFDLEKRKQSRRLKMQQRWYLEHKKIGGRNSPMQLFIEADEFQLNLKDLESKEKTEKPSTKGVDTIKAEV